MADQVEVLGQQLAAANLDDDNIMNLRKRHGDDLVAFCAGSGPRNESPAAFAVSFPLEEIPTRTARLDVHPTINRANLMAAMEAMVIADELDVNQNRRLVIYSHYLNLVNAMGVKRWVDTWESNNWRKANRKPVENRDIYQELRIAEDNNRLKEWRFLDVTAEPVWLSSFHDEAKYAARSATH